MPGGALKSQCHAVRRTCYEVESACPPAIDGSLSCGIPGVMDEQTDLWCEPCRLDLVEFASRPENVIPDFPFDEEPAQERVSQQLAERENRQAGGVHASENQIRQKIIAKQVRAGRSHICPRSRLSWPNHIIKSVESQKSSLVQQPARLSLEQRRR